MTTTIAEIERRVDAGEAVHLAPDGSINGARVVPIRESDIRFIDVEPLSEKIMVLRQGETVIMKCQRCSERVVGDPKGVSDRNVFGQFVRRNLESCFKVQNQDALGAAWAETERAIRR